MGLFDKMKSHLSHILPVSEACEILGRPTVKRIVSSLLSLRYNSRRKEEDDLREDLDSLVDALFFTPPPAPSNMGEGDAAEPDSRVPPAIEDAWQKWLTSRPLAMDKNLLIQFLVPHSAQPHSGAAGHMGLFDCWIYTLQGHAPSSSATYYGGAASQLVVLPDILIVLAVCQDYRKLQKEQLEARRMAPANSRDASNTAGDVADSIIAVSQEDRAERVVWKMAVLAYRMYDSYQKKGIVARDTIHRFLTDVHGEDSYKEPKAQVYSIRSLMTVTTRLVGYRLLYRKMVFASEFSPPKSLVDRICC